MHMHTNLVPSRPTVPAALHEHLRELHAAQLARLHENWRFAATESPADAIHDLRVATRRLRAFADVIEHGLGSNAAKRCSRRLKRITKALGDVRNADVLTGLVEQRLAKSRGDRDRAGLEHFLELLVQERARAERKARERLDRIDEAALSSHLRAALEDALRRGPDNGVSLETFARQLVARRTEDAIARAPARDADEDVEQLHRLRIAVKKLRYALELFEPALDPSCAAVRERALSLQDFLGEHHDLAILGERVETALHGLHARKRRVLAAGLAKLVKVLRGERARLIARYAPQKLAP